MSGVYIKGMEMPKSCLDCRFYNPGSFGAIECKAMNKIMTFDDDEVFKPWKHKHDDCPLIPVPEHGRLIDAEALKEEAQKRLLLCEKYDNQFQKPYEILRAINKAPTIIEAEE